MPHNLFVNTNKLWVTGKKRAKDEPVPQAIFRYDDRPEAQQEGHRRDDRLSRSPPPSGAGQDGDWVRYQNGAVMTLENGDAVEFDNVVIQQVKTTESDIVDVVGYPSPEVEVTGTGKAWLLRNGKLITGTW